jgi:hypothetical protein
LALTDKDDIFDFRWEEDDEMTILHISLSWSSTSNMCIRHWAPYDPRNTEEMAIGKMWDVYGRDIIAYIKEQAE